MEVKKKSILFIVLIQIFFIQTVPVNSIETEELSEIISEFKSYVIIDTKEVCWNNVEILFTMEFEGTTIPPADMIFLSNSIMILKWHSYPTVVVQTGNRFFRFFLDNNQLKLISIDLRHNTSRWLDVASSYINDRRHGILFIDEIENSITYDFSRNRILFGGINFFLNEN
jgi:hypothetical protein